jgi:thiaminase/transcriptional activator TenA
LKEVGTVWTDDLRSRAAPLWLAAEHHPFVAALGAHTLPADRFRYFIGQDAVYLSDFSRVLAMGAVRSSDRADERLLLSHAATVHTVEAALHQDLAPRLGIAAEELAATPPGPVTAAYGDHLVRAAWTEPLVVLVAALLPCYVLYRNVARAMKPPAVEVPEYREWIDTYSGAEYGQAVDELTDLANRLGSSLAADVAARAARAHWRSIRYEWLFWEQAWTMGQGFKATSLGEEPTTW